MREDDGSTTRSQERVYQESAEAYDALVAAEDADGHLPRALAELVDVHGKDVVDVGAGTGRVTRVALQGARSVCLVERARPMLELAEQRLGALGRTGLSFHVADARALPLPNASVDVAVAGWVFGHFRHWMPQGWRNEVDAAVSEMRRVLRAQGTLLIIETLGTGHTTPRTHEALDEYFTWLETHHGLTRRWVRTDYAFPDEVAAARVLGPFFGEAFAERVRRERWARVPECTGIWSTKR
ncbi:MAG: class I SAM-dependent methyltransferase [Myxococcales bacterium]